MKYSTIVTLALVLVKVAADPQELNKRIMGAQNLLLSQGPSFNVLNEYDTLIHDIEASGSLSNATLAQVYYKKALVAIGINKNNLAAQDLLAAVRLDPDFSLAADKLVKMWLKSGQFSDIRTNFAQDKLPDVFRHMEQWESTYRSIDSALASDTSIEGATIDEYSAEIDNTLIAVAPDSAAGHELKIRLAKYQAARGKQISFDDLARDYIKVTRLSGSRDLAKYSVHSQFLLFTQGKFSDAWNTVKSCLRIDNEFQSCGRLSKVYSKLQNILKAYEEYFVLDEYLYGGVEAVVPDEKLALKFDSALYRDLASPVKLSKKEMKELPSDVKTNLEYLLHLAKSFCTSEFPGLNPDTLPFVKILNKFACELSIEAKSPDRKALCAKVSEDGKAFLPKHLAKVDSLLNKRKYEDAKHILGKYSENVQRTDKFQKRYRVIQEHEERLQRERQQRYYQQQQQRQEQFHQRQHEQQQQQSHFDRSKDYYKILDISKDADEKTIKKAYRTQTLKYHPDKYKGGKLDEAAIEAKMQDINEAYEVLSNPSSKADYDRGGAEYSHGRGGHAYHHQHNVQFHMNDFMQQFMRNGF